MTVEIERKFLADHSAVPSGQRGVRIWQVYMSLANGGVLRVRRAGDRAWIAVKRHRRGAARTELEAPMPIALARELMRSLRLSRPVTKRRYRRRYAGRLWEVDVFEGENRGLIIAEVELERMNASVALPPWVGEEVTGDRRFANASLADRPFQRWSAAERAAVLRRARCGEARRVRIGTARRVFRSRA